MISLHIKSWPWLIFFVYLAQKSLYNITMKTPTNAYEAAEMLIEKLNEFGYRDLEEKNEDREFFEFTRYGQTTRVIVDIENQSVNVIRFNEHKVIQWKISDISLDVPLNLLVQIVNGAQFVNE